MDLGQPLVMTFLGSFPGNFPSLNCCSVLLPPYFPDPRLLRESCAGQQRPWYYHSPSREPFPGASPGFGSLPHFFFRQLGCAYPGSTGLAAAFPGCGRPGESAGGAGTPASHLPRAEEGTCVNSLSVQGCHEG